MDLARFSQLLDAYGAEPRRWPREEREAALRFLRTDARAAPLLTAAGEVDDLLLAFRVPAPSPALAAAALAGAPRPSALRGVKLWWAALGLGLMGAGGALAGSLAGAAMLPGMAAPADMHEDMTAFGSASLDDVG